MGIAEFMAHMDKKANIDTQRIELLNRKRGMFTASEFFRLMTYEDKGVHLPKGAMSYAKTKAVQMLTEPQETQGFTSSAMQWGIDNELKAVAELEQKLDITFSCTGENQSFIQLNDDIGCTPDGISHDNKTGVEVKCPNSETHFDYCQLMNREDFKQCCIDYYWQVQGTLMITGFEHWHFISYDPRYPVKEHQLKHLIIKRHESDIEHLKSRLGLAIQYRNECVDRFLKAMS